MNACLQEGKYPRGMFSNVLCLGLFSYLRNCNLIPQYEKIYIDKFLLSLYGEWNNFFEDFYPIVDSYSISNCVFLDTTQFWRNPILENLEELTPKDLEKIRRGFFAFKEKLIIKKDIEEKVKELSDLHEIKNCIGMHIRRTDHFQHLPILPEHCFTSIIETAPQQKFFIATDDKNIALAFKSKYPNVRINENFIRSESKIGTHYLQLSSAKRITLGKETLIDTLLLSNCKEVIGTISNVTTFVQVANPIISFVNFRKIVKSV